MSRVPESEFGAIIILNGPSSSGKTTIARALQGRLRRPHQHLQLDAFRSMEPPGYWANWEQDHQESDRRLAALCRAMNAAVSAYSRNGQGVIFDMAFTNPASRRYMLVDLAGLPVHLIGVSCAAEELTRRENERGDREPGLAVRQSGWIHDSMHYDLEIDSSASSPQACADLIATWLQGGPERRAFDAMRAGLGVD